MNLLRSRKRIIFLVAIIIVLVAYLICGGCKRSEPQRPQRKPLTHQEKIIRDLEIEKIKQEREERRQKAKEEAEQAAIEREKTPETTLESEGVKLFAIRLRDGNKKLVLSNVCNEVRIIKVLTHGQNPLFVKLDLNENFSVIDNSDNTLFIVQNEHGVDIGTLSLNLGQVTISDNNSLPYK